MLSQGVKILGSLAFVISTVGGGVYYVEDRFDAKADVMHVASVEKELDVHVLSEQIDTKQERIYKYEDRLERKPNDAEAKERLRELKTEKKHLEEKLEEIKKD